MVLSKALVRLISRTKTHSTPYIGQIRLLLEQHARPPDYSEL